MSQSQTKNIKKIINKAVRENDLTKKEILTLLKTKGRLQELLYRAADEVRSDNVGEGVHLRGIIEFSNYCSRNCSYCGLNRNNQELSRYRLEPEQIISMAAQACELGYKTIVLQSGEDDYYDTEMIKTIINSIKEKNDTAITLCVGEREYREYEIWKKAGADRFLLRHETSDSDLYEELHPGYSLESRLKRLKWLKQLGYQVGSGNLIGIPGQTLDSIAEDILLFKKLKLEMVGLGPFIVHPVTQLDDAFSLEFKLEMTLKAIAITRLILPNCLIPATTALGTLDPQGRQKALQTGANVVMPNVTLGKYRAKYELYPAKICIDEEPDNCRQCIGSIINSLNRSVAKGHGHFREG